MAGDTENSLLEAALKLQQVGFRLFPIAPNTKDHPLVKEFADVASNDVDKIKRWWSCPFLGIELSNNIGISTRNLADGRRLIGFDIDNKEGKHGDRDVIRLAMDDKDLPETFEQFTPTGGRHLVYWTDVAVGNTSGAIAPGIDTRGKGGYLVGAGSEIDGKLYTAKWRPIAKAPEWLVRACQDEDAREAAAVTVDTSSINQDRARKRGEAWVRQVEGAKKGARGSSAYQYAARLKDFGCSQITAYELLAEFWAERCDPPMTGEDENELILSVQNAYRYGKDRVGVAAPETMFDEVEDEVPAEEEKKPEKLSPIEELNRDHAFVLSGGGHHILWETKDEKGVAIIEHLKPDTFHAKHASKTMILGNKSVPITRVWMIDPKRRSYDRFCFRPGLETSANSYNFWRGFAYEPLAPGEDCPPSWKRAVDDLLAHTRENVCKGDAKLYRWLVGYFAHMVQRPWEKPQVALVFQGRKGVGKSALIERIGELFGPHFWSVADQRYLVGNFNSHLEQCVVFVLEEAFWSGDKKVDGILKNLITGQHHVIEHKGQEPYKVDNCTRVVIIGNDDWLVPASEDERRYAVFKVGEKRRRDKPFFRNMKDDLRAGGHRLLLRYLLDFDLSTVDIDEAPNTEGLLDQKLNTMGLVDKWWYESLSHGEISYSHEDGWPSTVIKTELREAYARYARAHNSRALLPDQRAFGRVMTKACPALKDTKIRVEGEAKHAVFLPSLEEARAQFASYMECEIQWE